MKTISELIDELIEIQEQYGDIEVVVNGYDIDYIDSVIHGQCGWDDFGVVNNYYCNIVSK